MAGLFTRPGAILMTLRPDTQSDEIESSYLHGERLSTSPSFVSGLIESSRVRDPGLFEAWRVYLRDLLHIHRYRTINATTWCDHQYPLVDITTMKVASAEWLDHEYNEHGEPLCRFLIYSACRCGKRKVSPKWVVGENVGRE